MSDNLIVYMKGLVGKALAGSGTEKMVRLTKTCGMATAELHGDYNEAALAGQFYTISNAVGGVAPGTALSTTPPICLHNPLTSGKYISIVKTAVGYVSGTLGAGSIVYATVAQTSSPTTGSSLTPVNHFIGGQAGQAKGYTGSTISAAGTILKPAYSMGAALATTATFQSLAVDFVDGAIIIPPGYVFVMQGVAAAGSSPLVIMSISYEELDIIG